MSELRIENVNYRYKNAPRLALNSVSCTFQPGTVALALTGLVAAALVVHGFGMKVSGRMDGGADFEKIRKWDEKHPENSIGTYDLTREEKAKLAEKNCGHAVPEDDSEKGGQA